MSNDKDLIRRAMERIETLEAELKRAPSNEPVAVVGMGCRFPGGVSNPEEYWSLLREGRCAVGPIPATRLPTELFHPDPDQVGRVATNQAALLDDVEGFDAQFFRISPGEARSMDPQQRIALETSWHALEDAGIDGSSLTGTQTGIYFGLAVSDYSYEMVRTLSFEDVDPFFGVGTALSGSAGRTAHFLGTRGPAVTVETVCSSSLVALHLGVRSLRTRETDLVLCGGVNVIGSVATWLAFSRSHMLAPDGRSKAFDASADGYGRGEGCGVLVLKRLSDALRDGDRVHGVVRGTAVNQDGASGGLTVPSADAQQAVIRAALADAGVTQEDVVYVEAHGSGTVLGDGIELDALDRVLGRKGDKVLVGSVKSNIGHLEAAAGVAGLIKAVLALKHGEIPAHLHLKTPNPQFRWHTSRLDVPVKHTPWPRRGVAGVSSFGFTGTNAHAVLEGPPAVAVGEEPLDSRALMLAISAGTSASLNTLTQRYAALCQSTDDVRRVTNASLSGRAQLGERLAVVARDREDLLDQLNAFVAGKPDSGVYRGRKDLAHVPRVCLMFPGQGAQYVGMARELYQSDPDFKLDLDQCATALRTLRDVDLIAQIFEGDDSSSEIHQTLHTQPALLSVSWALARVWVRLGVEPEVVIGHSLGELTAALFSESVGLDDAMAIVCARAESMAAAEGSGLMASVRASAEVVAPLLEGRDVWIASLNGPASTVLSGAYEAVSSVLEHFAQKGVKTKQLQISIPAHCPLIEKSTQRFSAALDRVTFRPPKHCVLSNVDGEPVSATTWTREYWLRQLCAPVRFMDSVKRAHELGARIFIEAGPKPTLLSMGGEVLSDASCAFLPTLRAGDPSMATFARSLAELHVRGANLGLATYARKHKHGNLPLYPFDRKKYWFTNRTTSSKQEHLPGSSVATPDALEILSTTESELIESPPQAVSARDLTSGQVILVADGPVSPRLLDWFASPAPILRSWDESARELPDDVDTVVFEAPPDAHAAGPELATLERARRWLSLLAQRPNPPRLWFSIGRDSPNAEALSGLFHAYRLEHPRAYVEELRDVENARHDVALPRPRSGEVYRRVSRGGLVAPRLTRVSMGAPLDLAIHRDACYLVTGAFGHLGKLVAHALVDMGARNVALLSRQDRQDDPLVQELGARGARAITFACDVADSQQLDAVITNLRQQGLTLRGAVHCAGTPSEHAISTLSADELIRTLSPKARGAFHLHERLAHAEVDLFVLMSSMASLLSSAKMAAYIAANRYLDGLVELRRRRGLRATAIMWGPLSGGMLADSARVALSASLIQPHEVRAHLPALLSGADAHPVVFRMSWLRYARHAGVPRLLEPLESTQPGTPPTRKQARPRTYNELLMLLQHQAALVLGYPAGELPDPNTGFFDLGMTSLLAIDLKERLEAELGCEFETSFAFDFPTIESLSRNLVQHLATTPALPSEQEWTHGHSDELTLRIVQELVRIENILGIEANHAEE